jgi:hypothetical protein
VAEVGRDLLEIVSGTVIYIKRERVVVVVVVVV